ncbi:unnamed protein product [Penicillium discolor]
MEKTKQEIETQALLELEQNRQPGDTAYSNSAGDAVHSTTEKRNPASTPASAKQKNTDRPLPASYVVKPRQGPSYDSAWYHSPLQEPAVYHMSDPAAAVTAYADIKVVNKRVQFDLRNMKAVLLKEGLIEDSDSEDGDASSDCSMDFFDSTISSSCSRGSNGACYVKKYINSYCEREHWKVQEAEAKQMLHEYLTILEDHMLHPKRHSKSITKSLVFGIRTKPAHDEYIKCRHLAYPLSLYRTVLNKVKERRQLNIQRDYSMDWVLHTLERTPLSEHELRFLGCVLIEAGSDTSLILTIIQAVSEYPEVQAKYVENARKILDYCNYGHVDGKLIPQGPSIGLNVYGVYHDSEQWVKQEHIQPECFASLGVGLRRIRTPRPPRLRGGPVHLFGHPLRGTQLDHRCCQAVLGL